MSSTQPLDIKTVYSASGRRARPIRARAAAAPRAGRHALLGWLCLLVALALGFTTWWPVDKYIYMKFVWETPAVDMADAAAMFGIAPADVRQAAAEDSLAPSPDAPAPPRFTGQTAQRVIAASAYGWLTLSTVSFCLLALAAGAAWSVAGAPHARRIGRILFIALLLGIAAAAYWSLSRHGRQYPPIHLRFGMLGLLLLCATFGLALGRGVLGLARASSVALILAAGASAAALYLGYLCAAVPAEHAAPLFLALVFVIHSLFGWILLPLAPRLIARR